MADSLHHARTIQVSQLDNELSMPIRAPPSPQTITGLEDTIAEAKARGLKGKALKGATDKLAQVHDQPARKRELPAASE